MRSKPPRATAVCLLITTVLSASPVEIGRALDRSGARTFELQRDLRSVRSRVERAPRASSFDLKNLQRRLHDRRIDTPGDPRLQELAIELRRLRARADRAAGRPSAAVLSQASPLTPHVPIEKSGLVGGTQPTQSHLGQRVVAVQRNLAVIEDWLEQGDPTAAAQLLEAARADFATLRRGFDRAAVQDPNLVALEGQITALEEQLAAR